MIDIGLGRGDKKKILVVDDEPALQSLVFDTLSDDYRIFHAQNGRIALEKTEAVRPDLILMDIRMPDMGGYEAVRHLQNGEETNAIPVIVITSMGFDPSTVDLIRREPNVKGFLTKPFRAKQLRAMVKASIK